MDALPQLLARLDRERVAVGHFNVADMVLLKAVLAAAGELTVPVLIGASEGERRFFGDDDPLGNLPHLESEIDQCLAAHGEGNSASDLGLKARLLCLHFIIAQG